MKSKEKRKKRKPSPQEGSHRRRRRITEGAESGLGLVVAAVPVVAVPRELLVLSCLDPVPIPYA